MGTSEVENVLGLPEEITSDAELARVRSAAFDRVLAEPSIRDKVGVGTSGNPITIQRVLTGAEAADKLIKNAGNAGADWEKGVQRPAANFQEAAIKAKEKHKNNTQKALAEDRFAKGMAKVNVDEAIATALAVGASGYTAGINARKSKITRVFGELMPLIATNAEVVDRLPDATDADREKRMVENLRGMREIGKKRRGG